MKVSSGWSKTTCFRSTLPIVMAFLVATVAFASHQDFASEDPALQRAAFVGVENTSFYWWHFANDNLWWRAEDPSLRAEVAPVIENWKAGVPQLTYIEVGSGEDFLYRRVSNPCGSFNNFGCVKDTDWIYRVVEDASLLYKGEVQLNPNVTYTPDSFKSTVAHETGHLYGLAERYIEGTGSCSDEFTIMDTNRRNLGGIWEHCDGLKGPAPADISRVGSFYSSGLLANLTVTPNSPSVATWTWNDAAWAEADHRANLFRWNGASWDWLGSRNHFGGIGIHQEMAWFAGPRTMAETFDRTAYGPPGLYIVCGDPGFIKFNTRGTWTCGDPPAWIDLQ